MTFLLLLLGAASAQAATKKFVYVYSVDGELLQPINPAALCPDPATLEAVSDACRAIEVAEDGSYNLALKTDALNGRGQLVIVVHRVDVLKNNGATQYALLQSQRRVDDIQANQVNANLDVNPVSEALAKAVEKNEHIVLGQSLDAGDRAQNIIRHTPLSLLNASVPSTSSSATAEQAVMRVNSDNLTSEQQNALTQLAFMALQSGDNAVAKAILQKNITQGLLAPDSLNELVLQTSTLINAATANDSRGVLVLQADRYLAAVGETVTLTTANSVNAGQFFGYSWTGVESDSHSANFSRDIPGVYSVCVTGEAVDSAENSSDCVRIVVKDAVVALLQAEKSQVKINETIWVSGEHSIGAEVFAWSGDGAYSAKNQARAKWTAPSEEGEYTVTLTVNGSVSAGLTIQVINARPIGAISADKKIIYTIEPNSIATLTSLSHSSDGAALDSLLWQVIRQPAGAQPKLSGTTAATTQFSSPHTGEYTVQLTAYKNGLNQAKTVDILVLERNAPVAVAGTDRIAFRQQKIELDGSRSYDPDNDPLTHLWQASGGRLENASTATAFFSADTLGEYNVSLTVSDGTLKGEDSVTVSVINAVPVADDGSMVGAVDTMLAGQLMARDHDRDPLQYTVVEKPARGKLTVNKASGAFSYTPSRAGCGAQKSATPPLSTALTAQAADDFKQFALVSLTADKTVLAANETATLKASGYNTTRFSRYRWTGVDSGSSTAVFQRAYGGTFRVCVMATIEATGNETSACVDLQVQGDPEPCTDNGNGYEDQFRFQVTDGHSHSNTATVVLRTGLANHAPTVENLMLTTPEDASVEGQLLGRDPDGNPVRFKIDVQGSKGTAEVIDAQSGVVVYHPAQNQTGVDQFTYTASDGFAVSTAATVMVTIDPTNDAPSALAGSMTVFEDGNGAAMLQGEDIDGDELQFVMIQGPVKGEVVMLDAQTGAFRYTPYPNMNGADGFQFAVRDQALQSAAAWFSIQIDPVNDAPVAQDSMLSAREDILESGRLSATDSDGDALTYRIIAHPALGTLTITDTHSGVYSYTPNANTSGSDSFTFAVNDGSLDSNTATVSITVAAVNDAPVAHDASLQTTEEQAVSGQLQASDYDVGKLTYRLINKGGKGETVIANAGTGAFTYTPAKDMTGTDSITFRASDGDQDSNTATVTITITPVNDTPVADPAGWYRVEQGATLQGSLGGKDVDGDALRYQAVGQPGKGTVSVSADGAFSYTAQLDALGNDAFTFSVSDGSLTSPPATVSLEILAMNQAPVAQNSAFSTFQNAAYGGRLAGSDADGHAIQFELYAKPQHGEVALEKNGAFLYTPQTGVTGSDQFSFRVYDGGKYSNIAGVAVSVVATTEACRDTTGADGAVVQWDSDGDGYADVIEKAFNTDPHNKQASPLGLDPLALGVDFTDDDDADGFADYVEIWLRTDPGNALSLPSNSSVHNTPACIGNPDTYYPRLLGFNIDTPSVDASGGGAIVQYSLSVVDNGAGIKEITVNLQSPGGDTITTRGDAAGVKVYYGQIESDSLSRYAQAGVWTVSELRIQDVNGNRLQLSTPQLIARGYPTQVTVTNQNQDLGAADLLAFTILTPDLDVSQGDAQAQFDLQVADTPAGVAHASVYVQSPSGRQTRWGKRDLTPVAGSVGVQIDSNVFSAFAETGTWQVSRVELLDAAGNSRVYLGADLVQLGFATGIDVHGRLSDVVPPQLETFLVLKQAVNLRSSARWAGFDVTVSDDFAGVADIRLRLLSPTAKESMQAHTSSLDHPRHMYKRLETDNFAANAETGDWYVEVLEIEDASGNVQSYSTQQLIDAGYKVIVKVMQSGNDDGNRAPQATGMALSVAEDTLAQSALSGSDADGDALLFGLLSTPAKGSVTLLNASTGSFTYMPYPNATGNDAFTFNVSDGRLDSATATVQISLAAVNDTPLATPKTIHVISDQTYAGFLSAADVDADTLTYSVAQAPVLGQVKLVDTHTGQFQFIPNSGVRGDDQFTFKVNDGSVDSNTATVQVSIEPLFELTQFQVLTPQVNGNDTGTVVKWQFSLAGNADKVAQVRIYLNGPNNEEKVIYRTPDGAGFPWLLSASWDPRTLAAGAWTFNRLSVQDKDQGSYFLLGADLIAAGYAATFTVTRNSSPSATDGSFFVAEDSALIGQLTASDADQDPITYTLVAPPAHGVVQLDAATGQFRYTPNTNVNGVDSFTFYASDGKSQSDTVRATLTIDPRNDAPTAANGSLAVDRNKTAQGLLLGNDIDGDQLNFTVVTQGSKGTVTLLDSHAGSYSYIPHVDAIGSDTFTYKAGDAGTSSAAATVTVSIRDTNQAPVAETMSFPAYDNKAYAGQLKASDPDNDKLIFEVVQPPQLGSLLLNKTDGRFTYTARSDEKGEDSFSFRAGDGAQFSNTAAVSITVQSGNLGIPVADAQTITVYENVTYEGALTGYDSDNDALSFRIVTSPDLGQAFVVDAATGVFRYTPHANHVGADTFQFVVNDGVRDSQAAAVKVTILATAESCNALPNGSLRDSDKDGFADVIEHAFRTGVNDSHSTPAGLDAVQLGVSFTDDDDGDGFADYVEVWLGSDPLDAGAMPTHSSTKGLPFCFVRQSDGIKPRLLAMQVVNNGLDISGGDARLRFAMTVADNASGVRRIRVNLSSAGGAQLSALRDFTGDYPLLAGVAFESETISAFAEEGDWLITAVHLYDEAGNKSGLTTGDLLNAGLPSQVRLYNFHGDGDAPALLDFNILTPAVDPTQNGAYVGLQIHTQDNGSGLAALRLDLMSPSGTLLTRFVDYLGEADADREIRIEPLSVYLETGVWSVASLQITDLAGNSGQYAQQLPWLNLPYQIQVNNPQSDSAAPSISGFEILTPQVYPASGPSRLRFAVDAADDLAGIKRLRITLQGPSGQLLTAQGGYTDTYPRQASIELSTQTLSHLTEDGTWVVTDIELEDEAGNLAVWLTEDLQAQGYATEILIVY